MSGDGRPSIRELSLYYLRLGSLGFGGPVALANAMRRDLVEERGWLSEAEYDDGLAIAAACPGPLAYQLGVYCGYIRQGVAGGLAVAVSFALPPFLLVVAAAWLYTRFANSWQVQALFYGVGPVVVALIFKACWNLGRKTLRRDPIAWTFFLIACAITVVVERELTVLFLIAGALGALLFAPAASQTDKTSSSPNPPAPSPAAEAPATTPKLPALVLAGGTVSALTGRIFLFFFKTGLLVFGSGLVIVPFLKTYIVDQYHWLDNRQFLDSVAIGLISPGPVVITATFVGFLLNGFPGAIAATAGMFAPAVLLTVLATPLLLRYGRNRRLRGFIRGITVTVVGVLVGTTWLVAKSAVADWVTGAIAVLCLLVLALWKKAPEPLLVGLGAAVGLVTHGLGPLR
ncbi:MAG TPA: chromate efflux transporter, partial [Thermoanaerobaculia bacterium]